MAAGAVFFRLTHDNDFVPFLPRRPVFVHCGARLFLSHGHIIRGEEYSQFARHLFRKTSSKRMMKRKQQGMQDHIVRYEAMIESRILAGKKSTFFIL
jgi:hypothetical protein